jgi:di/tricarboxylate transporter
MFITATAPNPLIVKLVSDVTASDISITWGQWALGALIPGLVCIAFNWRFIFNDVINSLRHRKFTYGVWWKILGLW